MKILYAMKLLLQRGHFYSKWNKYNEVYECAWNVKFSSCLDSLLLSQNILLFVHLFLIMINFYFIIFLLLNSFLYSLIILFTKLIFLFSFFLIQWFLIRILNIFNLQLLRKLLLLWNRQVVLSKRSWIHVHAEVTN